MAFHTLGKFHETKRPRKGKSNNDASHEFESSIVMIGLVSSCSCISSSFSIFSFHNSDSTMDIVYI